jgi:hypothetical protein
MEFTLYILLFIVGLVTFYLSTRANEHDISNTYQVELSLLSLVIFAVLTLSSFNIQIIYFGIINNVATTTKEQVVDMAYFGINLALMIMNLLNIIIIFTYGSFNRLFNLEVK